MDFITYSGTGFILTEYGLITLTASFLTAIILAYCMIGLSWAICKTVGYIIKRIKRGKKHENKESN